MGFLPIPVIVAETLVYETDHTLAQLHVMELSRGFKDDMGCDAVGNVNGTAAEDVESVLSNATNTATTSKSVRAT